MNAQDAIRGTMKLSTTMLKKYLDDLTDADLMCRPGPTCNHVAWQLGHLIASSYSLLEAVRPGVAPPLPEGYARQHGKEGASENDPAKFCTKQQYLDLYDQQCSAVMTALQDVTEADLDQRSPEKFKMFPTVGSIFILLASHPMVHAGQIVPVRRALGKPIVI